MENKYSQALYDMQKRNFKQENEKNQEIILKMVILHLKYATHHISSRQKLI